MLGGEYCVDASLVFRVVNEEDCERRVLISKGVVGAERRRRTAAEDRELTRREDLV